MAVQAGRLSAPPSPLWGGPSRSEAEGGGGGVSATLSDVGARTPTRLGLRPSPPSPQGGGWRGAVLVFRSPGESGGKRAATAARLLTPPPRSPAGRPRTPPPCRSTGRRGSGSLPGSPRRRAASG